MLRRILLLLLIVLIGAVAVYLLAGDDTGVSETGIAAVDEGPGIESDLSTAPMIDLTGRLLTWVGDGSAPNDFDLDRPGSLLILAPQVEADIALRLPQSARRATTCTEQAVSPNGQYLLTYVGNNTGRLYMWDGTTSVATVDAETHLMTCLGLGTVQYAPDSTRFAYIDYPEAAASEANPAVGTLRVLGTSDRAEVLSFDSAAGFNLSNDAVAIAGLFADATQVGIQHWTTGTPVEVSTLTADEGCTFRLAQVIFVDDATLAVLAGQSCVRQASKWTLDTVNIAGRSTTRIADGTADGGYFGQARTNNLFVSTDGVTAYFSIPDGGVRQLADLYAVSLVEPDEPVLLADKMIVPQFGFTANQRVPTQNNALPVLSSDGTKLAFGSNSDGTAINLVDLSADGEPFVNSIRADRDDHTISAMAFTPAGDALLYVIGENNGGNNSLFSLDMFTGIEERLVRGRFGSRMVVASDGSAVALGNWQTVTEPRPMLYMDLVSVMLADNTIESLLAGAEIGDNGLANQRFFYPLMWR